MSRRGTIKRDSTGYYFIVDTAAPGAPRRQLKRRFRTRKEAQAGLTAALAALLAGTYLTPSKITLGAFVEGTWLPWLSTRKLRATTIASYSRNVRAHVLPQLGARPLQSISRADVERLYVELLTSGRRDHAEGGPLSSRTVNYVHVILKSLMSRALELELVARNPCPPRAPGRRDDGPAAATMKVWTAEQLSRFLSSTADHEHAALWITLARTGLRRGEALGLGWSAVDVDSPAPTLRVERTLLDVSNGEPVYGKPKTTSGWRTIPLDPAVVAALRAHRQRQRQDRLIAGARWADHGLVFTVRPDFAVRPGPARVTPPGSPLHPERLSRTFSTLVRRAGLPELSVHGLRHTYATLHLKAGTPPKVVQELLGHSSIVITLNIYTHVQADDQVSAVTRLAGLLDA